MVSRGTTRILDKVQPSTFQNIYEFAQLLRFQWFRVTAFLQVLQPALQRRDYGLGPIADTDLLEEH